MELPIALFNDRMIAAGDMSGDIDSSSKYISEVRTYSVQATWSGSTPLGTVNIRASNDGINFKTLDTIAVSGNTGTDLKNYPDVGYYYLQIQYDSTSGTGTLNVYVAAKR